MIFSHYSKTPVGTLELKMQRSDPHNIKPDRLWVSIDGEDDWSEWCQLNDYDGCGPYHYRVHLDLHDVLVLDTFQAVRDFDARWGKRSLGIQLRLGTIDWRPVADEYTGIIIAPYQWELRMDLDLYWYNGWDCASECIWDPAAVIGLEQMPSTTNADNRARSTP